MRCAFTEGVDVAPIVDVCLPSGGGQVVTDDRDMALPSRHRVYATLIGVAEQLLAHQLPDGALAPLTTVDDGVQMVIAARYGTEVVSATAMALTMYTRHGDDGPPVLPLRDALRQVAAVLSTAADPDHVQLGAALATAVDAAMAGRTVQPDRNGGRDA